MPDAIVANRRPPAVLAGQCIEIGIDNQLQVAAPIALRRGNRVAECCSGLIEVREADRLDCVVEQLLDLDDPSKVIGRTKEPILTAVDADRSGYVPNVVYSCGALINNGQIILPYAMSDYATNFATLSLKELLGAMT